MTLTIDMTDILDDLLINKEHYKELINPYFLQLNYNLKKEDNLFRSDILEQFQETSRWKIANDFVSRFHINIDDAYILLENVNIRSIFE